MDILANRLGKIAILAAIASRDEEELFKKQISNSPDVKLTVTIVAGVRSDVNRTFVKSVVSSALSSHIIPNTPGAIHGVIHAALECLKGLSSDLAGEASLKLKVTIAADRHWVVVAAYGESAFRPETNHERMGFGIMHI